MEQGYPQGSTDSRSSRKAAYESSLSGREAGEGGARNKDAEEDAQKEPVRTYTGKKRGRKPREHYESFSSSSLSGRDAAAGGELTSQCRPKRRTRRMTR